MKRLHRYQISDLILETNVRLPEARISFGKPECRFFWMDPENVAPRPTSPYQRCVDSSGKAYAWFYRREDGYHIRVRGLADFTVSTSADKICCYPRRTVPTETIRHLFLDLVLPAALSRRGRLSLHASAVATADGAIGFLGGGGKGKSTLGMALSRRGYPLLCDDFMVVKDGKPPMIVPAYTGVRLYPDAAAALAAEPEETLSTTQEPARRRHMSAKGDIPRSGEIPLRQLYILGTSEASGEATDIAIEKATPSEAVLELIKCAHLLDRSDKDLLRAKFHRLTALAASVPCYRLSFPRDFSRLEELCSAALVGASGTTT